MTGGSRARGAGGVDWREVCARMREAEAEQAARLGDPEFVLPEDRWALRAKRFARRVAEEPGLDASAEWIRAQVRPADVVLDVGAGTGRYVRVLAPQVARLIAVEPSAGMRGELVALIAAERLANVEVVAGAWPLAGAPRADVVLCIHVVYAVADLVPFLEALDQAARRLCALVCGMRPPNAVLGSVWETVHGEPRRPLPGALEILNLLHQLGIPANLQLLPRRDDCLRYADRADALRALRHRLHLMPEPARDACLQRAIGTLFDQHPDGSLSIRPVPDDAVLWWDRAGPDRAEPRSPSGGV